MKYRKNRDISVSTVRVVDEEGNQLGIMNTKEAIKLANDRGLDLIEIVPKAMPPVAKIVEYGKFMYEKSKEQKKQSLAQRRSMIEVKELRFRPNTNEHDIDILLSKASKFLEKGNRVKFCIRTKGRESANMNQYIALMDSVISKLDISIVQKPLVNGRQVSCVVEKQ